MTKETTGASESKNNFLAWAIILGLGLILIVVAYRAGKNTDGSSVENEQVKASKPASQAQHPAISSSEMILVPAGKFIMGTDEVDASGKSQEFGFNEPLYLNEQPRREIDLPAFYMDKYEVSNAQFVEYLHALGKYSEQDIANVVQRLQMQEPGLPVRNITWYKAEEYCSFVGKRLPTEAEWEKAARGTDGREYPWGNDWNQEYVNKGQGEADVVPVGSLDKGKSPYGIYEMAGNVMEWTADWYEAYPGAEYKSPNYGHKRKVARGGSWGGVGHYVIPHYFRTAYRFNFEPDQAFNDVGFRCAKDS